MECCKSIVLMLFAISYAHAMDKGQAQEWSGEALRKRAQEEQCALQNQQYSYYCLDKHPTKPELAVVRRGKHEPVKHVALYDAHTFECMGQLALPDNTHSPICVAYSPDGQQLAIGDDSGCVCIVSCMNNQRCEVGAYKLPDATAVKKLVWSFDGKQLAIAVAASHLLSYQTHMLNLSNGEIEGLWRIPIMHLQFHPTQVDRLITLRQACVAKHETCVAKHNLLIKMLRLNSSWMCKLNTNVQPLNGYPTSFCISADGQCYAYTGVDTTTYVCDSCGYLRCGYTKIKHRGWIEFNRRVGKLHDRAVGDLGESDGSLVPKLHYIDDMKQFVCCYGSKVTLYSHEGKCTNWLYVRGNIKDCAIVAKTPENITFTLILAKLASTETSLEKVQLMLAQDKGADSRTSKNTSWWKRLKKKM